MVFFEGDALVVESTHLRASVCDNALACELAFLVGETRVAAIEGHGPELRHVAVACKLEGCKELAIRVRRGRRRRRRRRRRSRMLGGRRSERIGRGGRASLSFGCADMQICRYAGKIEGKKLGLFKVI